jgi:hypothetical protein
MIQEREELLPFGIDDAVDVSARVLGLQLDLCPGSRAALGSDRYAIGYLWGFCGGTLAILQVGDPDVYRSFSLASRRILPERDAVRILAGILGMAGDELFQDGEAAGLADARTCLEQDRPPLGLVLHLSRG